MSERVPQADLDVHLQNILGGVHGVSRLASRIIDVYTWQTCGCWSPGHVGNQVDVGFQGNGCWSPENVGIRVDIGF